MAPSPKDRFPSWSKLIVSGVPATWRVLRHELVSGDTVYKPGDTFPATIFNEDIRRIRLRQYFDAKIIAPVIAPPPGEPTLRTAPTAPVIPAEVELPQMEGSVEIPMPEGGDPVDYIPRMKRKR